jgi:hypothetical protein
MATDRSIRTLNALCGASSNRVMNLCALAPSQTNNASYYAALFFHSPKLNTSIIYKHNVRANERDFFDSTRVLSTKVIIPFNVNDLSMGGRSLFGGQKKFPRGD